MNNEIKNCENCRMVKCICPKGVGGINITDSMEERFLNIYQEWKKEPGNCNFSDRKVE